MFVTTHGTCGMASCSGGAASDICNFRTFRPRPVVSLSWGYHLYPSQERRHFPLIDHKIEDIIAMGVSKFWSKKGMGGII
jgi:hypothetical protein